MAGGTAGRYDTGSQTLLAMGKDKSRYVMTYLEPGPLWDLKQSAAALVQQMSLGPGRGIFVPSPRASVWGQRKGCRFPSQTRVSSYC